MVKRTLDIVVSATGLIILLPLLAIVGIAIKLTSPGSVLYRSSRIGRDGQPFKMVKFRTMIQNADQMGSSVTTRADPRVTRIGHFLRGSKLDELPQLWNILAGEMTLVGPRPESPDWVTLYTPEMRRVLVNKPGLTDMAQIVFRHEEKMLKWSSFHDQQYVNLMKVKVALQLEYMDNRSILKDLRILFYTLAALWAREADPELEAIVVRLGQGTPDTEVRQSVLALASRYL